MQRYTLHIKLTIMGPFLTAATSSETYGLDKSFHRSPGNLPEIPGSHIKGKLRMSLEELRTVDGGKQFADLGGWFGQPSAENSYEPSTGQLHFSSFTCEIPQAQKIRVRTAINPQTLIAEKHHLHTVEDLFSSGALIDWVGKISYYAENAQKAREISAVLYLGFKWLTNLGAEKGVGSGRLAKVWFSNPTPDNQPRDAQQGDFQSLHIRIRPVEYLMIGGVKKPRTNFVASERVIPGSVIKGAIAAGLNEKFSQPVNTPLSAMSGRLMPGYEMLAENFELIRVTHAFPTASGSGRPVHVPISTVQVSGKFYDRALSKDPTLLIDDRAPIYFIDWKKPWSFFGEVSPKEVFKTSTSIENKTRRSQEGQLFTYTHLCAVDEHDQEIEWICNVDFESISDPVTRKQVIEQFADAAKSCLFHLGKLNQEVRVSIHSGQASPLEGSHGFIFDDLAIITLQSDSIMLDPQSVRKLKPGEDLFTLYSNYWQQISCMDNGGASFELIDFYAHQKFQGGYLYHRYLGAGERHQKPAHYYPYYLTCAGSVFILKPTQRLEAQGKLQHWRQNGLDLPKWAEKKYGQPDRKLWQNCPFVPQNGYGEIQVNLNWHWTHRADRSHDLEPDIEVKNG